MTIRGLINTPPMMNRHPLTGEPIEPVGVVGNKVIWPIMGGAPDPDDDDEDGKSKDADNGDGGAGDADKDKTGADDGDNDGDDGSEGLNAKLNNALERMKAADKRAAAAEAKIKEQERSKMDEVERLKADLKERDDKIAELQTEASTLRMNTAFVTANKVKWHDPDAALKLAQSGGYLEGVIDDEGEINKKAMGSALDRLAKDKPFLVKSGSSDDDANDKKKRGPSGEPGGSRSDNNQDDKARKQNLKKRFPVLNR